MTELKSIVAYALCLVTQLYTIEIEAIVLHLMVNVLTYAKLVRARPGKHTCTGLRLIPTLH